MIKKAAVAILVVSLVLFLFTPSCKHDPVLSDVPTNPQDTTPNDTIPNPIPCDLDTAYFQNQVLPIFLSNCAKSGCHDAASHKEDVILTDYNNIMQTGEVEPFNPGGSKVYEVLISTEPDEKMPPPPEIPLTVEQVSLITKWINQGAINNSCENLECDSMNVTFSGSIWPIIQTSCKGCHSGSTPGGGIQLVDHGTIAAVVNGDRFFGAIEQQQGFSFMPKNGSKLPNCNIAKFKKWKQDGTPHN